MAVLLSAACSVNTITHEPLHLAWWNFARTCTPTTSRTLLSFKVIGQGHKCFGVFCVHVNMITHELLHLAWWNFARTCTPTTSRTLLNIKVIGQRSRSHGFFVVVFLSAQYLRAVLSLKQEFYSLHFFLHSQPTFSCSFLHVDPALKGPHIRIC